MTNTEETFRFLILLIPYLITWFLTFRLLRLEIITFLNYSVLLLVTLISLIAYLFFISFLCQNILNRFISDYDIVWIAFPVIIILEILIVPVLILTLILTTIFFINKRRNKTTRIK